jgi:hypothetical protein
MSYISYFLNLYKQTPFPKEQILPDCIPHSEILFSNDSTEPTILEPGKKNYQNNYITEIEKGKHKDSNDSTSNWRTPKNYQAKAFDYKSFQKPKPNKFNTPDTNAFSPSNKEERSMEHSFENRRSPTAEENLSDNVQKSQQNKEFRSHTNQGKGSCQGQSFILPQQYISQLIQSSPDFDIKIIYSVNKRLQLGESVPLWYLFHSVVKSSYGPLSSIQIESMFNNKQVFSNSLIRLIDIFEKRNAEPFSFFFIKDLNDAFINDIGPSKLWRNLGFNNVVVKENDFSLEKESKNKNEEKRWKEMKENKVCDMLKRDSKMDPATSGSVEEDIGYQQSLQKIKKKKKKNKNIEERATQNKISIYDSSLYTNLQNKNIEECYKNSSQNENLNNSNLDQKSIPVNEGKLTEQPKDWEKFSDHDDYYKNYEVQNDNFYSPKHFKFHLKKNKFKGGFGNKIGYGYKKI